MSKAHDRGQFISLEGGEGAGKSTQARLLQAWLSTIGVEAILTREPGGSSRAECLRELLLEGHVKPFGSDAEALVFAIARADHVATTIRPALDNGQWVICDRFIDLTRAYQGSAGVSEQRILELEAIATKGTIPDLTIILDLAAEDGLQRARSRNPDIDRFESDNIEAHEARRQAFHQIAHFEPQRCVLINADQKEEDVFSDIRKAVSDRLADALSQEARS